MSLFDSGDTGDAGGYQIEHSLRLRRSASASLSRTPGAAGNRKTTARRFRIKRGGLGTLQVVASAGTASIDRFYFDSSDRLCLDVLGTTRLVTARVFRDPTAWEVDVGFELDVGNGTAALRAKIIYDGVEVSSYSTDSRASITNTDTNWNNTVVHYLGRDNAGNYFDGYMAEPVAVDGATTVIYSTTNADGVLVPAPPSATYGTQGSLLSFNDGSSLTNLCLDRSGNGNNWTATNVSLTAGATYDWMVDTPTNNYAVLNAAQPQGAAPIARSEGNLRTDLGNTTYGVVATCTQTIQPGEKVYFEGRVVTGNYTTTGGFGVVHVDDAINPPTTNTQIGYTSRGYGYLRSVNLPYKNNNNVFTAYGTNLNDGDVVGVAFDNSAGSITFYLNGVSQGVAFTGIPSGAYFPAVSGAGWAMQVNFGQRPFAYTPPTGFKALCTANRGTGSITTSGTFTGNASADGPCIWLNGNPETMTINGNAVTWGTHADKLAGGFKVRTASASYNASGTNTYSVTVTGKLFGDLAHAPNTAKGNP